MWVGEKERTNITEGFNRQLWKVTKSKSVSPTDDSPLKIPHLAMMYTTKNVPVSGRTGACPCPTEHILGGLEAGLTPAPSGGQGFPSCHGKAPMNGEFLAVLDI